MRKIIMNTKIKILIGVLVVGILVIGGLFIVNNQFKEAELLMNETVINFEIKEVLPIYESNGWHIYELYQDNWREIELSCIGFGCRIYGCENGNPIKMCADPGPPICREIDNKISFKWDLKKCIWVTKYCGTEEYKKGKMVKVDPGKYKAKFCYYLDSECSGKEKCIEKEFEIK